MAQLQRLILKQNQLAAARRFEVEFQLALARAGIDPENVQAPIDGENIPGSAEGVHWPAVAVIQIRKFKPHDVFGVWLKSPPGKQVYFEEPIVAYPRYNLVPDYERPYNSKPKDVADNILPPEQWHAAGAYP